MHLLTYIFSSFFFLGGIDAYGSERPGKKIAVVQLSFDGINTLHCGVGTVVLQTQQVLKELAEEDQGPYSFKLHLISGDYSETLQEYSHSILEKNIEDCLATGGNVHLIPIAKKDQIFGDPTQ